MQKGIDATAAAARLKAVSNPARLRIALCLLGGERSVTELENELGVRQPNLSQHLAELRSINLVATRREVKSVYYRLADDASKRLVSGLLYGLGGDTTITAVQSVRETAFPPKPPIRRFQAATFAKVNTRIKETLG